MFKFGGRLSLEQAFKLVKKYKKSDPELSKLLEKQLVTDAKSGNWRKMDDVIKKWKTGDIEKISKVKKLVQVGKLSKKKGIMHFSPDERSKAINEKLQKFMKDSPKGTVGEFLKTLN